MSSLAALNDTLLSQGKILTQVSDNTAKTSGAIDRFVSYMETKKGDELEEQREMKQSLMQKIGVSVGAAGGAIGRGASSLGDKFDKFTTLPTGLLTGGGLLAFGKSLFGTFAKKGIPAALGVVFADEIGDWVTSQTGKKELGDAAERATLGGSFGSLLGKRFGLIGVAVGALATDENMNKLGELGENLKKKLDDLGIKLPDLTKVMVALQEGVGKGLDGINALITGDWDTLTSNFKETAGLLAGMALLIAPGPFMRGLKNIALFAGTRKGGRLLAIAAAVAAGTYVYDKFFDGIVGDDGSGEITTEDIVGGAAVAGGAALAAKGVSNMVRRGPTAAEIDAQRAANTRMPSAPRVYGTLDGKNVVKTAKGNYAIAGADGKATSQVLSEADLKKMKPVGTGAKWWQKFPRIKGLRGIPGSALLFAALDSALAASIMMDDSLSMDEKIEQLGPLIGGTLGTIGFGLLGGAIGSAFPGPGTLIGGVIGTLAGYFGGDYAGRKVAAWLIGKTDEELKLREAARVASTLPDTNTFDESYTPAPKPRQAISKPQVDSGVASGAAQITASTNNNVPVSRGTVAVGQVGDNVSIQNENNTFLPRGDVSSFNPSEMIWDQGP